MTDPRFTLISAAQWAQEIKKSRFFVQAAPATTPADALAFIDRVADSNASHNCWAYRIGQQYRFFDDNEPASTAGKPILQAILGQNLDRVVVVVTRYFGGIKLGSGGLMRAYGGSAAECLRAAKKAPLLDKVDIFIVCDFHSHALLQARLRGLNIDQFEQKFTTDSVELRGAITSDVLEEVRQLVRDITRGRGTLMLCE